MAYKELIKNFEHIRDYMREFYVYGFKSRDEFDRKSSRSYDDERRRIESWLGDYMGFRQTPEGKNIFIAIDSRVSCHNPLYKAWKAKSFTDGDITLHFILFDILSSPEEVYSLNEITEKIDEYLSVFQEPKTFDESTIRKKLKEYVSEGLVCSEKQGKIVLYRRAEMSELHCESTLDFFSEAAPCGVIGSFLLDRLEAHEDSFAFKHHYITDSLDSGILCSLFDVMHQKRDASLTVLNRNKERTSEVNAIPLRILISVQSGRQYLMAYCPEYRRITSFRLDNILSVRKGEPCVRFDELRSMLDSMQKHMWGVSTQGSSSRMEHVEFTVRYGEGEGHIHRRLEREKRCGCVERLDSCTSRFTADVYDTSELIPWIRTFICRIIYINFSNKVLERQFKEDIEDMYRLYGLDGGGEK